MDIQYKLNLIKQVGEEIITEEDLKTLLQSNKKPLAYDGFEPSGRIHIAQGILRTININRMLKAGCGFKMLVADWHAWANNKFGGDLERIQKAGDYFIEVWKAAGLDTDKVDFIRSSDLVNNETYWKTTMQIARNNTLNRIIRCSQIMGRKETDTLMASQIFYPCMQCADIFELGIDITQLGMDQRKVNMLAREMAPKLKFKTPVVVSHHMLMGLGQPPAKASDSGETKGAAVDRAIDLKMSKSKPDSAIFMDDSKEDIKRKINKAYCPEKIILENPIMEYCRYILFPSFSSIKVERPEKYGGNLEIGGYEELCDIYSKGLLHPMDLKTAVSEQIDKLIEPVRKHFEKNAKAKKLLEEVKSFEITR